MKKQGEDSPVYLFCWFDEAEWNKLRVLAPDGLDDTYEIWRKAASEAFAELKAEGHNVKKASLKVAPFKEWCDANSKDYGSSSRSEYVAARAQKESKN